MKVNWTYRAKDRLRKIYEHIAEDNEVVATKTVEKILRRSWRLAEPPEIGHKVIGYEHTELKEILLRPYRVIYIVKDQQIDIISVLHYRQLLPSDLSTKIVDL